ncbi:ester cyclase [Planotetraspora sp. GP83]|uniref:ester cyclase n=1 Tax=Planotetraspora sp. GP83 TaxID=3156264 RepID=UPI00351476CB
MTTYWDLKHRLGDTINAHDLPGILSCYSTDAVYVTPSGVAEGHDQIAWMYEQFFRGFPDFHATAWFELSECDNPAITEWTYTGTHTGPFLLPNGREIVGTGHRVALRATCATHVQHGKITSHREYFDQLELYSQLGFGLTELEPRLTADTVDGDLTARSPQSQVRSDSVRVPKAGEFFGRR